MISTKYKTHCQAEALTVNNQKYRECLDKYLLWEIERDFGDGDLTTDASPVLEKSKAVVVAKENGIFAGEQEIKYLLCHSRANGNLFRFVKHDGDKLKRGEIILKLKGKTSDLMKIERVVLNAIGRMSGIATYAAKLVKLAKKANPSVLVTPTRKTLWGLIDKRACVIGGAGTHRLALDNAILIKHNHIKASKKPIKEFLDDVILNFPENKSVEFLEIEVKNIKDALIATKTLEFYIKNGFKIPCFVMFDNMKPKEILKVMTKMKNGKVLFEASGGINEKNLVKYAKTGVDVISIGSLTHSAPMLDVSMSVSSRT